MYFKLLSRGTVLRNLTITLEMCVCVCVCVWERENNQAVRSKAYDRGSSIAGIAGSNPDWGFKVCPLGLLYTA